MSDAKQDLRDQLKKIPLDDSPNTVVEDWFSDAEQVIVTRYGSGSLQQSQIKEISTHPELNQQGRIFLVKAYMVDLIEGP